jgi:hypothetical protein
MKDISCEAFIDWCDEMYIAEESIKDINQLFAREMKEINSLKDQAKSINGDYTKMCELYQKALKILTGLRQKIDRMNPSVFDKIRSGSSSLLAAVSMVVGGIGGGIILGVPTGGLLAPLGGVGGMVLLGRPFINLTRKSRERIHTKENVLKELDMNIDVTKKCIAILQHPETYGKYLKKSNGDILEAQYSKIEHDLKPILKDLVDILNKKITPWVNKYKKNSTSKFIYHFDGNENSDRTIEFSDRDILSNLIYSDEGEYGDKEGWEIVDAIQSRFIQIVNDFEKKNKKILDENHTELKTRSIRSEHEEDWYGLRIFIEVDGNSTLVGE